MICEDIWTTLSIWVIIDGINVKSKDLGLQWIKKAAEKEFKKLLIAGLY